MSTLELQSDMIQHASHAFGLDIVKVLECEFEVAPAFQGRRTCCAKVFELPGQTLLEIPISTCCIDEGFLAIVIIVALAGTRCLYSRHKAVFLEEHLVLFQRPLQQNSIVYCFLRDARQLRTKWRQLWMKLGSDVRVEDVFHLSGSRGNK